MQPFQNYFVFNSINQKSIIMKQVKRISAALFFLFGIIGWAQESGDYVEFNDRKNVVHGVYLGFAGHYGKIAGKDTYLGSVKIAYVANQQFEVGFVGVGLYSEQNYASSSFSVGDFVGGYGGLHLEPIFFGKSKVNLSLPLLIGGGAVGFLDGDIDDPFTDVNDWEAVFVFEPGISILYNISRYVQLETGFKYRISSNTQFVSDKPNNINGYSVGLGIKIGVFNMGRNRYKKNI